MNHRTVSNNTTVDMSTNDLASSPLKFDSRSLRLLVRVPNVILTTSSMEKLCGPAKKKKSVSFATKSRCLVVPSHRDMTNAEKEAIWRTPDESRASDFEVITTVNAARRGRLSNSFGETVCLRGLEAIICPATGQRVKKRQMNRINAVLEAQNKQWQEGFVHASAKMLKRISTEYSKEDAKRAIMQAASDEAYCRGMRRLFSKAA
mmetsp:Transcript_26484/g.76423  ORF Transcript_26484/g.76423 Transcript_26484/m.76423 type:complete len:205 (-) Transcript_26484:913-1527(-)